MKPILLRKTFLLHRDFRVVARPCRLGDRTDVAKWS